MGQNALQAPLTGLSYANIAATGTLVVKASSGILYGMVINSATTGSVVTIYDNTAGSGTVIAAFTLGTITTPQPIVLYGGQYGLRAKTGITVVVATQNCDLTFTYD